MPTLAAVALVALLTSLTERLRRHEGGLSVEGFVLAASLWLGLVGVTTTLVALVGQLDPQSICITATIAAAAVWPWGRPAPPLVMRPGRMFAGALVIVVAGLALRWPLADYPLGGRDQGTYTLRAQHTAREGRLHAVDSVLANVGSVRARPGPADLRGLYNRGREPWRRDQYEAAYRPGFYLSDVDRGQVRPQFFHALPTLMATAGIIAGPAAIMAVVSICSALALLALFAIARRLWPRGPWAWLAAALWVCSPLAVWVQRTALSEGPATVMVLGSLLAALRARHDPPALTIAALLLGANAWIRGNGWLAVPMVLAAQWLAPTRRDIPRTHGLVYAAVFLAAVFVHAPTTFPYLHDELLRQLPIESHLSPTRLILGTTAGLVTWLLLDELGPLRRHEARWLPILHRGAPAVLALGLVGAIVFYLSLRPDTIGKPFSRLDPVVPLLGIPMLVLATVGLGRTVRGWECTPSGANAWLLGLGLVFVATVWLYAQRNLPQLGLYYYGRYLVPDLLPACILLAVEGLRACFEFVAGRGEKRSRTIAAVVVAGSGAVLLGWSSAGVLIEHPVTRLQEFDGADRVLDHLAEQLPDDAIVIAGGEGWHSGHTYNQVGGALAFRHGIAVLPYRDREAAYATLHELLVERPAHTGETPPVYLLLNEATKDHTRHPKDPTRRMRIAALDDMLPPPFVARRIDLVEMFLNRLTPTHEGFPVRVTRDGLRMALLRIEVDPTRQSEVERWRISTNEKRWAIDGPGTLTLSGGKPKPGAPCLGKKKLTITVPPDGGAGTGPVSLVLVAAPGTAQRNHQWKIEVDGTRLPINAHRTTPRDRDTLGPFVLTERPSSIVIRGSRKKTKHARCPRGGLAEVRLLGPDAAMLATAETTATTFAPTLSLGHPVEPVAWVSGRGLSRHRPGIKPKPKIHGLSLRLGTKKSLTFAPAVLPDAGRSEYDLVLTLTGSQVHPGAQLVVSTDGIELPPIEPPEDRRGSWQSPAITIRPTSAVATFELELRNADADDHVMVRDIGLFSRAPAHPGELAPQ